MNRRVRNELLCAVSLGASAGMAWAALEEGRILIRRLSVLKSFEEMAWDLFRPEVMLQALLLYATLFAFGLSLVAMGRILAKRVTGDPRSTLAAQAGWLFPFVLIMVYRLARKLMLAGNTFLTEIPDPTAAEWAIACVGWPIAALFAGRVLGGLAGRPLTGWLFTLRAQWALSGVFLVGLGLPSLIPLVFLSRAVEAVAGRNLEIERDPGAPAAGANVLLIVMDTARADRFGAYGYDRPTSPAIDGLARRGFLFRNARTTAPWTLPAHASLFTGLYPGSHHATGNHTFLGPEIPTIAEVLASAGYDTACFTNNSWLGEFTGMSKGFGTFVPVWHRTLSMLNSVHDLLAFRLLHRLLEEKTDNGADITRKLALLWLKERAHVRPYFLFLNLMEAHQPNYPAPMADRYLPEDLSPEDRASLALDTKLHESGLRPFTPRQISLQGDLYDGEIAYLDRTIGRFLKEAELRGKPRNTLVVITADHGEGLGEHGQLGHQFALWDTLLRIPLVVATAGGRKIIPAGGESDAPIQIVDVPATLVDLLGLRAPGFASEGRSFAGLMLGGGPPLPAPQVAEYETPQFAIEVLRRVNPNFDADRFNRRLLAYIEPPYKLIWSSTGSSLYRIGAEDEDLFRREPEVAATLQTHLDAWSEAHGARGETTAPQPVPEPDPVTRDMLRTLGYTR